MAGERALGKLELAEQNRPRLTEPCTTAVLS